MTMQRKACTLMALAAVIIEVTMAINYTVGAPAGGWDLVTDLATWGSGQSFRVGDNLHFTYGASHSVLEVTEGDYGLCDTSNPITSDTSGSTTVPLDSPIKRYFICGTDLHCQLGMKLGVNTLEMSTPPPPAKNETIKQAPPPPQTPSFPPVTMSPPPPPDPSSPTTESPPPPTPSSPTTNAPPPPPTLPSPTMNSPPPPFPSTSDSLSSSNMSTGLVVGIATAGVIVLLVFCVLLFFCWKKRSRDRSDNHAPPPKGHSQTTFTYKELATATNGFSDANLLGQGGFGYVHKGILPNGLEVAVKQLKIGSRQGEREFQAEIEIISRVHHKHIVSLVGYCMTGSHRLLVYEFVPNNTLEFHLHGEKSVTMDWPTRLKTAVGSAKGLAYLHEECQPKIIHRDIKAANVLLNFGFEAKVADFGLAKFYPDAYTHVSTRIIGTFGYLAPEYAASGKLTEKSDVFSFGVVLLELITGRRPLDTNMDDSLVVWAMPLLTRALEEGNFSTLVDERLKSDYDHDEMLRMVSCAAASVRQSAPRRPRMSQIVRVLEGHSSLSDLDQGIKAEHRTVQSSHKSSDYDDTSQYNVGMTNSRKMTLEIQEMGSSGNLTSEYCVVDSSGSGRNTQEMEMGETKRNNNHRFMI